MSSEDDPEIIQELPGIPDNLEEFSFDEWRELHEIDPERFEIYRLKVLNDMIDSAPEQSKPRLRGLMFKMEGESRRSKSRLGYNMRLSSMMMEMLGEMREHLFVLCEADVAEAQRKLQPQADAKVIPFTRTEPEETKK